MTSINMNDITQEMAIELAQEMGSEIWLNPISAGRGWYTCIVTGKKMRGQDAQQQIAEQEEFLISRDAEITEPVEEEIQEIMEELKIEDKVALPEIRQTTEGKPVVVPAVWATVNVGGADTQVIRTEVLDDHMIVKFSTEGKHAKTVIINCCDCGTPREIKVQDQFQVKRCPACQKAHRNAMRREKRRQAKLAQQEQ